MHYKLTWTFGFILIVMLGLSIVLISQFSSSMRVKFKNTANNPDSFVTQASYLQFDMNGHIHSKFFASKVVHYTQNNVSNFTAPQIVVYGQDYRPWLINADHGKSQHGSQQIELTGNVKIQNLSAQRSPELTLLTSTIEYFSEQQFVQTDKPVTIIQPGMVITAQGLQANLKTAEVKLMSKVRARYEIDKIN